MSSSGSQVCKQASSKLYKAKSKAKSFNIRIPSLARLIGRQLRAISVLLPTEVGPHLGNPKKQTDLCRH